MSDYQACIPIKSKLPKQIIEKSRAFLLLEVDKEIPLNLKVNTFSVHLKPVFFKSNIAYENLRSKELESSSNKFIVKEDVYHQKMFEKFAKEPNFNMVLPRKMSISDRKLRLSFLHTLKPKKLNTRANLLKVQTKIKRKELIQNALKYLQNLGNFLRTWNSTNYGKHQINFKANIENQNHEYAKNITKLNLICNARSNTSIKFKEPHKLPSIRLIKMGDPLSKESDCKSSSSSISFSVQNMSKHNKSVSRTIKNNSNWKDEKELIGDMKRKDK